MRWLLIGDSILEGMAPYLAELLAAAYPSDAFRVLAFSGWSTRRWLREGDLAAVVRDWRPGLVVIMLGTNDEGEERSASYASSVRDLAAQATSLGAELYWIAAWSGTGTAARYRIIRRILETAVDGTGLMRGVEMSGEIHPSSRGYRLLALHTAEAIVRLVEGTRSAPGTVLAPLAIGATLAVLALILTE
jgi:lysophospholipase L1-like esterase